MKDPSDELLDALYTALNTNVSYGGVDVPVYTRVISWEDRPSDQYIQISEVRMIENGPKDAKITEGTVDIFVDTFFTGKDEGSKVPMNSISNSSTLLIDTTFSLSSFTQVLGRVESLEDFDYELDPQGAVFRKLITYSFIIEEN
jgi:hypothetical protein